MTYSEFDKYYWKATGYRDEERAKVMNDLIERKVKEVKKVEVEEEPKDDMRRKRDFNGNLHDRELLEKISDGRWCLKEEVVICDGVTYHKNDPFIITDVFDGNLVHQNNCVAVITDIKESSKGLLFETKFTKKENNKLLLPFVYKGSIIFVLNEKVFEDSSVKVVEDFKLGCFKLKSDYADHKEYADYKEYENSIKYSKDKFYNFKYGMDSPTYLISEGKSYTFGVEIETSYGLMPSYIRDNFNFKCVYDGSLKDDAGHAHGGEYVSGVLKGDKGFEHLKDFLYQASRRCQINAKAGVHVHIGVNPTSDLIVHLYKLSLCVQDELYKLIPYNRRGSAHCKYLDSFKFDFNNILGKDDYNNRIDEYYSIIYQHYSGKGYKPGSSLNKLNYHPKGQNGKCNYDQHSPRYCWLNLIPAMFQRKGSAEIRDRGVIGGFAEVRRGDPRPNRFDYHSIDTFMQDDANWLRRNPQGVPPPPVPVVKEEEEKYNAYTAEFRLWPASLNFNKIKNHIKICMALVYYAENYQKEIQNRDIIPLEEIIIAAFPKRGYKLVTFMKERMDLFASTSKAIESNEYKDSENMKQDIMEVINS